jgi:hypothetical protein
LHGENGPDKGNNLKALVVVGPDSGATINIKAAAGTADPCRPLKGVSSGETPLPSKKHHFFALHLSC